jgi:hypothetical protein
MRAEFSSAAACPDEWRLESEGALGIEREIIVGRHSPGQSCQMPTIYFT